MTKKKSSPKRGQFARRMAAYSVAAGATAGLTQAATAAPIRVDLNPFEVILSQPPAPSTDLFDIDIDGDSFNDFRLFHSHTSTIVAAEVSGTFGFNRVAVSTSGFFQYAIALDAGDTIGPSLNFPAQNNPLMASNYTGIEYGNFGGEGDKFLALQFSIGANTHYGWALVNVADISESPPFEITLKAYGYESNPDTPILAGAVPEPGSLGMLALGAAGVLAWRRARRGSTSL